MEDQKGLPFVGPAGRLLRRAVDDAGLDPGQLYLTNAVKHFRFELRGKRRIHQTPDQVHITACRPWLVAEFARLRPEIVVVLGATAAKALLGPSFRVTRQRGELLPWPESAQHPADFEQVPVDNAGKRADAPPARLLATIHPSAVLRADDQDKAYEGLVADLTVVHPRPARLTGDRKPPCIPRPARPAKTAQPAPARDRPGPKRGSAPARVGRNRRPATAGRPCRGEAIPAGNGDA